MSTIEIQRFVADLNANSALRAEAEKVLGQGSLAQPSEAVIAFAVANGYSFTTSDVAEYAKVARHVEDSELDGIAGGNGFAVGTAFAIIFGQLANRLYERETGQRAP